MKPGTHKRAALAFFEGKSMAQAAADHGLDALELERFVRAILRWPKRVYRAYRNAPIEEGMMKWCYLVERWRVADYCDTDLNRRGAEGWEVVAVVYAEGQVIVTYKAPLEEG